MPALDTLAVVLTTAAAYAVPRHLADRCADRHAPFIQALGRLVTLPGTYLHELAHAAASILCTGRGRVRLHALRGEAARADGQVCLGSADVWFRGPRSNWLVSAAPALLWWPLALLAVAQALTLGRIDIAALAGLLAFSARLSSTDIAHMNAGR